MGHGSHVTGTAAGNGVLLDRSSYTGPYDGNTYKNGFLIGPGVAPEASLYALKVFGCDGFTDAAVDALDWAVANDLDVVNLSLGSPFGRAEDPMSVAATNAAFAGVVVVGSAGNIGRAPYAAGAPAVSDGALAVAVMDSIPGYPLASFTTATNTIRMQNSNGSTALPVNGPVRLLVDDPATRVDESLGCAAGEYTTVQPGDIVVTHRGMCPRADRVFLGTAAHAAAVVMINNAPGLPPFEGYQVGAIPFLGAAPANEAAIRAAAGGMASVVDAGTTFNQNYARLGNFSSSRPRNGDSAQKPDVTAPGVNINSTRVGSGYSSQQITGTSMAAPHVSGVAALVREVRPRWKATQVKAAIINTANPNRLVRQAGEDIFDMYRTYRAGSGLVSPADAVATEVVATGQRTGGGLSFGLAESTGASVDTKTITLTNKGDRAATYALSTDWDTKAGAPSMSFSRGTVRVPANGTATVDVTLRLDASLVPGGEGSPARPPSIATAAGNVLLDPVSEGEPTLRVPFLTVVRGTSSISTSPKTVEVADQVTFTCTSDAGVFGPIEVFSWGLSDPRGDSQSTDLRNVGFESVGGLGVFAIHTGNTVSNPSVNEWDVLLNTDADDAPDYGVVGFDLGAVTLGTFTGNTLGSLTVDLDKGTIVRAFSAMTGLNSGIVELPFLFSDVGLAAGQQEEFSYTAGIVSLEGLGDDVAEGTASFNPFTPPVETGQFTVAGPGFSPQLTATVNRAQLAKTPVDGWLVVYRYNRGGEKQADTIRLRT